VAVISGFTSIRPKLINWKASANSLWNLNVPR
jgi:hypothetical protein